MITIKELKEKYYKKIDLLDLELIISSVIKKPREFVLAHPEYEIVKSQKVHKVKSQIKKRIDGEPLAYIFGEKEFYGLKFRVNKNVLVPRPETEMMVNRVMHNAQRVTKNEKIIFIDVGTGSGCIIIALAKKILNHELRIMNYEFIGIDISKSALRIARQNAKLHKINKQIKFFHGNLLEPILKNKKTIIHNTKYIILANLPYLTPSQIKNSLSIKHEPKLALDAGKDGLKYYRELFFQIKKIHNSLFIIHNSCHVLCEIDPSQALKIKKIIKKNLPKAEIKIKKDFSGRDRLVIITA